MVLREIGPVAANRANLVADIAALNADGCTPLSESMYEAYLYLSGGTRRLRHQFAQEPGAPACAEHRGLAPGRAEHGHLPEPAHDVLPEELHRAADRRPADRRQHREPGDPGADRRHLRGHRRRPLPGGDRRVHVRNDLRPTLDEDQNAATYTIGFGPEVAGSADAAEHGARAPAACSTRRSDTATLTTVLTNIVRTSSTFNTSFTAPAVSVNAFNRTQNLNDLYVTVFRPSETYAWDGNIKKYSLGPGRHDRGRQRPPGGRGHHRLLPRLPRRASGAIAVDGDNVTAAARPTSCRCPATSQRLHATSTRRSAMTAAANAVATTNATITDGDARPRRRGATRPATTLINWLRGADVTDANGDGATTDARLSMGDPMNGRPATVIYGGTVANPRPERRRRVRRHQRGLPARHRRQWTATSSGPSCHRRCWCARATCSSTRPTSEREYGLDGNIRVVRNEVNENGVLEPAARRDRPHLLRHASRRQRVLRHRRHQPQCAVRLFRIGPNEAGDQAAAPAQARAGPRPSLVKRQHQRRDAEHAAAGAGVRRRLRRRARTAVAYALDAEGNQIFMVDAVVRQRALVCRPVDRHRVRTWATRSMTARHPGRRPGLRPDRRRLRRPHVRGRHGRARVALRHPQRPDARRPRHRRRIRLARQCPPGRAPERVDAALLQRAGRRVPHATAAGPGSTSRSAPAIAGTR